VCDPVTAGSAALGAIQGGMAASAANKQASRNYQHQLKVRERKWLGDRSLYQTKIVQHEQSVDLANIAAQRAYTQTQISLNNAQSLAILENQNDWMKMLGDEGNIEVSAAARGIRGKGIGRGLAMNKGAFGMTQAMRTRGLTMAQDEAKTTNDSIRRQLKGFLNESFSDVALQPIPDVAPPKPVMQNALLAAVLGGASAGLSAYSPDNPGWGNKTKTNTNPTPGGRTPPKTPRDPQFTDPFSLPDTNAWAFKPENQSMFNQVGNKNYVPNFDPSLSSSITPFANN